MVELEVVVVFVICMVGCAIMSWHIGVGDGFGAGLQRVGTPSSRGIYDRRGGSGTCCILY